MSILFCRIVLFSYFIFVVIQFWFSSHQVIKCFLQERSQRTLSSFVMLRTSYGTSQLRFVSQLRKSLGCWATLLLQGKYREGGITSMLDGPEHFSENSAHRQSELSENSYYMQIVAECPLVLSSSLQHSRWRMTSRGFQSFSFHRILSEYRGWCLSSKQHLPSQQVL